MNAVTLKNIFFTDDIMWHLLRYNCDIGINSSQNILKINKNVLYERIAKV